MLGKFSTILFKNFLIHFFFSSFSATLIIWMLVCLIWSQRSLRLSSTLLILFTLFYSSEAISTILFSISLIHSSASDILLLIPSRVFLISVIVLFISVCLFFNSSSSLLIDSYIFSILFSRFLIIFTIIILNSFSGSFPVSSSFICTCVSSLFLHLCSISLSFHYLFSYCVWGLLFPGFKESWILSLKKVEFFLPFGFCSSKVSPVVCVSFLLSEICVEFCLFVFPLMGKAEWDGNIVCWWLFVVVVVVVSMRCPAQGATGGWVMVGLVFKWFPLGEFSLFDTL